MIKKVLTYTDYDGNERSETFYFNLSKPELMEMQAKTNGGFSIMLEKIAESKDVNQIILLFKELIEKSFGEKSSDGKRFIKSKELTEAFMQSEAYSELMDKLLENEDDFTTKFIEGMMPAKLAEIISGYQSVDGPNNAMPVLSVVEKG